MHRLYRKNKVCPKSTRISKKNRKKACNVTRYVTLDHKLSKIFHPNVVVQLWMLSTN